jgi:hypothetical protein
MTSVSRPTAPSLETATRVLNLLLVGLDATRAMLGHVNNSHATKAYLKKVV